MKLLRSIIPLALLALAATPLATAGENPDCQDAPGALGEVCVGDERMGDGCQERDTFDVGYTYTEIRTPDQGTRVHAEGSEFCWWFEDWNGGDDRLSSRLVLVEAEHEETYAGVMWTSFDRTNSEEEVHECATFVTVYRDGVVDEWLDLGCPAGAPPTLPWGALLP